MNAINITNYNNNSIDNNSPLCYAIFWLSRECPPTDEQDHEDTHSHGIPSWHHLPLSRSLLKPQLNFQQNNNRCKTIGTKIDILKQDKND